MDPNVTLKQIRSLLAQADSTINPFHAADLAQEALDAFVTLDEWLTNGGFAPLDWASHFHG